MNPPGASRAATGGELWLLASPPAARRTELAAAFADAPPTRVLAHDERDCRAAGEDLARALGANGCALLPSAPPAALAALEQVLDAGARRVLAVLPPPALAALVAHALALPPAGAAALRLDPGRLTLLRDESEGFVLRRANVLAPERESGTALPTGRTGAR